MAITSTAIAIYFVEFTKSSLTTGKEYTLVETKPAEKTPEGGKPVSDSPKTGDNTNLWLWFMLLGIGATGTGANLWLLHISEFLSYVLSGTFLCTLHLKIGNKLPYLHSTVRYNGSDR